MSQPDEVRMLQLATGPMLKAASQRGLTEVSFRPNSGHVKLGPENESGTQMVRIPGPISTLRGI